MALFGHIIEVRFAEIEVGTLQYGGIVTEIQVGLRDCRTVLLQVQDAGGFAVFDRQQEAAVIWEKLRGFGGAEPLGKFQFHGSVRVVCKGGRAQRLKPLIPEARRPAGGIFSLFPEICPS